MKLRRFYNELTTHALPAGIRLTEGVSDEYPFAFLMGATMEQRLCPTPKNRRDETSHHERVTSG